MSVIQVSHLSKTFRVYKKQPGFWGSVKSIVQREYTSVPAVSDVSFDIEEGELVGFIGQNGAGKTTTLKSLSGLLHPSSGHASVLGYIPHKRSHDFLRQISLVMGQKNQLWWDLPAMESFLVNKEIYRVPEKQFKKTVDELSSLLETEDFLHTPVRSLSLGQRMKCELILSLIHQPKVLFLDEPTIGLDVVMQSNVRKFVKEYNKTFKTTIILTSHYMEDVKELCKRIIMIHKGNIVFDGELATIIKRYATHKRLSIRFDHPIKAQELEKYGTVEPHSDREVSLSVSVKDSSHVAAQIFEKYPVDDLNIEEAKIDDIIRALFIETQES